MWVVREQILANKTITTNHSYNTLLAAENQFNLLRNNWKNKYRPHVVELILIEYETTILKIRTLPPSS